MGLVNSVIQSENKHTSEEYGETLPPQGLFMAERVGFEPTIPLRVCRISSAVLSTTQPPLRSHWSALDGAGCLIAATHPPRKSECDGFSNRFPIRLTVRSHASKHRRSEFADFFNGIPISPDSVLRARQAHPDKSVLTIENSSLRRSWTFAPCDSAAFALDHRTLRVAPATPHCKPRIKAAPARDPGQTMKNIGGVSIATGQSPGRREFSSRQGRKKGSRRNLSKATRKGQAGPTSPGHGVPYEGAVSLVDEVTYPTALTCPAVPASGQYR